MQVFSIILFTHSSCLTNTVSEFSFIIPALCVAIFSIVFPNISTWSYPMFPIIETIESTIFVQSVVPPRPVSNIAISQLFFAKYIKLSDVIASNHFTGTLCVLL